MTSEPSAAPDNAPVPGDERPPKKSLVGWVFLLPAALLLGLAWQVTQRPERTTSGNDDLQPPPVKITTPRPVATSAPGPASMQLFGPGDDALLHPQTLPLPVSTPAAPGQSFGPLATRAIKALLAKARKDFPPNTILLQPVRLASDGNVIVDFSKEFLAPNFWTSDKQTEMTIEAIVQTVQIDDTGHRLPADKALPVQLFVDGKKVESLGEMDASEPFQPRPALVATS